MRTQALTFVRPHEADLSQLKDLLTRPNPAYSNAVAYGRSKIGPPKDIPKTVEYFYETENGLWVPRNCPKEWFTVPVPISEHEGEKMHGDFNGTLRDYQVPFMTDVEANAPPDKLLVQPCGHGKTVCSIQHACSIGRRTLVLVPTNTLVRQWCERIAEFSTCTVMPWFSTQSVAANKAIEEGAFDFVVMTYELFLARKPDTRWCNQFGHVIFDEAHRAGAASYVPCLEVLRAKYRTALTATFRRHDRMEQILAFHFGEAFVMPQQFPPADVWYLRTECRVYDSVPLTKIKKQEVLFDLIEKHGLRIVQHAGSVAFVNDKNESGLKVLDAVMNEARKTADKAEIVALNQNRLLPRKLKGGPVLFDSWLTGDAYRVKQLRTLLIRLLNDGRTVLFISKRTRNLKILYRLFKDVVPTALVMGGADKLNAKQESFMSNKAKLILGISQLVKEGLDVSRIDTLVCEHALSDVEQAIGRIVRTYTGKKFSLAIFPQDVSGHYGNLLRQAERTFPEGTTLTGTFDLMQLPKVLHHVKSCK